MLTETSNTNLSSGPKNGGRSLYNLHTDSLVVLQSDAAKAVEDGNFSILAPSETKILLEEGDFVDNRDEETATYWSYYDDCCCDNNLVSATVLLTTECNLACNYCFQRQNPHKDRMDQETAERVATDILYRAESVQANFLDITFTGGEPLMNLEALTTIVNTIKKRKCKIPLLTFSLITNGTLLTKSILDNLVHNCLSHIQVTIDGPSPIHNSRRSYSDGRGSYKDIIDTISDMAISKVINVVVDGGNGSSLGDLIDELSRINDTNNPIAISFSPRMGVNGGVSPLEEPELSNSIEDIICAFHTSVAHGMEIVRPGMGSPCIADRHNSISFSPSGGMYSCCNVIGNSGLANMEIFRTGWGSSRRRFLASCKECGLAPACLGGCSFSGLAYGQPFTEVNCQKAILSKLINGYVSAQANMFTA